MTVKERKIREKINQIIEGRIKLTFWVFIVLFVILIGRLIHIDFFMGDKLRKMGREQLNRAINLTPKRGFICDRNGTIFADNIHCYSIFAEPHRINNKLRVSQVLGNMININNREILCKLSKRKKFIWVKRKIQGEIVDEIKKEKFEGIGILSEVDRIYPRGFLASNIIGFVGVDNEGLTGIEYRFDKKLKGESGLVVVEKDASGREIPLSIRYMKQALHGENVFLTIDETIQHFLESELEKGMNESNSKGAMGLVMKISTGEILAMASLPNFDPNYFHNYDRNNYINKVVLKVWEPGSIFKMITAAAALDSKLVTLDDHYFCSSRLQIGGHEVSDAEPERGGHGNVNLADIIEKSCNVGISLVSFKIGSNILYNYIKAFGFGQRIDITLPGEEVGILPSTKKWSKIQLANIAFGQGIAVTGIQLANAYATIINDGLMIKPVILKKVTDSKGKVKYEYKPEVCRRVISQDTSKILREMMRKVVMEGTGQRAKVPFFHSAGKTGTAQIASKTGGYINGNYNSSFIGFIPYKNPRYLILVVFEEPGGFYYGGLVAAPVFKKVAQRILWYDNSEQFEIVSKSNGKNFKSRI